MILLNNDTEITHNAIEMSVDTIIKNDAVVGTVEYHLSKKGKRTYRALFSGGKLAWREVAIKITPTPSNKQEPFVSNFIRGSFMALHRNIITKVGNMDEFFISYLEDVDFSIRSSKAGYQLLIDPRVRIWHRVSYSASTYQHNYLMAFNYLKLLKKACFRMPFLQGFSDGGNICILFNYQ